MCWYPLIGPSSHAAPPGCTAEWIPCETKNPSRRGREGFFRSSLGVQSRPPYPLHAHAVACPAMGPNTVTSFVTGLRRLAMGPFPGGAADITGLCGILACVELRTVWRTREGAGRTVWRTREGAGKNRRHEGVAGEADHGWAWRMA